MGYTRKGGESYYQVGARGFRYASSFQARSLKLAWDPPKGPCTGYSAFNTALWNSMLALWSKASPKHGVPFLRAPIIGTTVFAGSILGPLYLGKLPKSAMLAS